MCLDQHGLFVRTFLFKILYSLVFQLNLIPNQKQWLQGNIYFKAFT